MMSGHSTSICECRCGNIVTVRNDKLRSKHTQSCGCFRLERLCDAVKPHGQSHVKSRTYESWCNMIQRCTNPKHPDFASYGGSNVMVCSRWRESFAAFLADMGTCPPTLEIDRWPNNKGNYEPGNCRWATRTQQNRNKANNRVITFNNFTGCVAEVCEHFNADYRLVRQRLLHGWSVERAFSLRQ